MEKHPEGRNAKNMHKKQKKKTKKNINSEEGNGDENHFGEAISIIQVTDGGNGEDGDMWKVVTCLFEMMAFNIHV